MCMHNGFQPDSETLEEQDVSAIVSALAKQQSDVEDQWRPSGSEHSNDSDNEEKRGGRAVKRLKKHRKGAENNSTSSDDTSATSHQKYHMSKDLHELSKMFIKSTLMPRPISEGNFQEQQQDGTDINASTHEKDIPDRRGSHIESDDQQQQRKSSEHKSEHHHHLSFPTSARRLSRIVTLQWNQVHHLCVR